MKIVFVNISGISKIYRQEVKDYFSEFDVVVICETWVSEKGAVPELSKFSLAAKNCAKKNKKLGRCSGGMLVYCKNECLEFMHTEVEDNFVRVSFRENNFIFAYNPPESSDFADKKFFKKMSNELCESSRKHGICLLYTSPSPRDA